MSNANSGNARVLPTFLSNIHTKRENKLRKKTRNNEKKKINNIIIYQMFDQYPCNTRHTQVFLGLLLIF